MTAQGIAHPHGAEKRLDPSLRAILAIAVPTTLGNLSVPLLALGDAVIIGRLGDAAMIGAVTTAATAFSSLFWLFSFLKMASAGLTAQAYGAGDGAEARAVLTRSLVAAGGMGLIIALLGGPLLWAMQLFYAPAPAVAAEFAVYFAWRIVAAPFLLMSFVLTGWMIGIGRPGLTVTIAIVSNLANLALTYLFALHLGLGVKGVAIGTMLVDTGAGLLTLAITLRLAGWRLPLKAAFADRSRFLAAIVVNRDLFIRTALLTLAYAWFTRQANQMPTVALAANGLLLTFVSVGSYFLDGMATAAEQLAGRAVGARRRDVFVAALRSTAIAVTAMGFAAGAILWLGGPALIDFATPNLEIRAEARTYLPWVALTPIAGIGAFLLDGIYMGATWTRSLRNWMAVNMALFAAVVALLVPIYGNHGLWAAMVVLYAARGIGLAITLPREMRRTFG